jgi:hypothetical protein
MGGGLNVSDRQFENRVQRRFSLAYVTFTFGEFLSNLI